MATQREIACADAAFEALACIVNALNAHPEPIHYRVRETIERGRVVLERSREPEEDFDDPGENRTYLDAD